MTVPKKIRHRWVKGKGILGEVHTCSYCGCWTANLPLYKSQICPVRDRRKKFRRKSDR